MVRALLLMWVVIAAGTPAAARQLPAPEPLLVVLRPTGATREHLPVFRTDEAAARYEMVLGSGYSGRLLRLYRWEQQFLHLRDGRPIEPAYLLLSTNEGGFPRFGFWLGDLEKAGVGYVDLHQSSTLTGRFGAMDQIFPHELSHVIVEELASPPPPGLGGSNQVHAIAVRTDRVTAFNEGFAEHAQVLSIDDPDARPETAALRDAADLADRAERRLDEYRRALEARWSIAPPSRMGFALWFGQTEQALRYHGVKAGVFNRDPRVPERLLSSGDVYPAYLLQNILPGSPDGAPKSTPRLLSTEGVVATLFARWVRDPGLQQPATDALYERFGIRPDAPEPLEHAYLKLFTVLADRQPHDAAALIRGYVDTFPDEAGAVASLARGAGFDWPLPEVPEIWLANDAFLTGTTMYDQYRAVPRIHTFDLNAASLVDLVSVDGVSPDLAAAILAAAPLASIDDLASVPGVSAEVRDRFGRMQQAMTAVREANARDDIESIDLMAIFRPVFVRAGVWMLICAVAAGLIYRRVRRLPFWRLALNGVFVSAFGLLAAWILGAAGAAPPVLLAVGPALVSGALGAAWQLLRRQSGREARRVLLAWALSAVPIVLVIQPLV